MGLFACATVNWKVELSGAICLHANQGGLADAAMRTHSALVCLIAPPRIFQNAAKQLTCLGFLDVYTTAEFTQCDLACCDKGETLRSSVVFHSLCCNRER